jgi:hypothetical protein
MSFVGLRTSVRYQELRSGICISQGIIKVNSLKGVKDCSSNEGKPCEIVR